MSKVRVVWTLSPGVIFRAAPPTLAHDSAHHEVPKDLDLRFGINDGIDRATVDYWKRHTHGLSWRRVKDTVIVTDERPDSREQLERDRIQLERDRIEIARARQR